MLGSYSCFLVSVVYNHGIWVNTQSSFLSQRTSAPISDPAENTSCEKDLICQMLRTYYLNYFKSGFLSDFALEIVLIEYVVRNRLCMN